MKTATMKAAIPLTALIVSLSGCGGGGDAEAGAPTSLSVVPTTLTVTAPTAANGGPAAAGACISTYVGQVFVYGGAGPYRIDNPNPAEIFVDKPTVDGPGGSFNVTIIQAACFTSAPIVIVDKLNRQVTFTLNNKPAATSTTTTP